MNTLTPENLLTLSPETLSQKLNELEAAALAAVSTSAQPNKIYNFNYNLFQIQLDTYVTEEGELVDALHYSSSYFELNEVGKIMLNLQLINQINNN